MWPRTGLHPFFMHDPPTPSENRVSFPPPRAPLSRAFRYEIGSLGGLAKGAAKNSKNEPLNLTRRIRFQPKRREERP
nr:MAG TPA: hypothetical protein [Caudoviricetes sp.]